MTVYPFNVHEHLLKCSPLDTVETIFSTCRRTLGSTTWGRVLAAMDEDLTLGSFPGKLVSQAAPLVAAPYY